MSELNCVWWNKERGSWSCCHLLNQMFDAYQCRHWSRFDSLPPMDGAILVFHGQQCAQFGNGPHHASLMNELTARWCFCIFVSIGDESQDFDTTLLTHPNSKLWIQAPRRHTTADRYLIQGYPAGTRRIDGPRDIDAFFAGQDTHARRHDCVSALKGMLGTKPHIVYLPTPGFNQGLPHDEYLSLMSRARFAPCPAGPATVDTFRVYEALECGAIPILDARSLHPETVDVWPKLLGPCPLPIIDDWSTLPEKMPGLLANYSAMAPYMAAWWRTYKLRFRDWLALDILSLTGGYAANERYQEAPPSPAPTA